MNLPRFSIFGRTFLLMVTALTVAVGIGVALLVSRPPLHNAPVPLWEVARQLGGPRADAGPPRDMFGGRHEEHPPVRARDREDFGPPPFAPAHEPGEKPPGPQPPGGGAPRDEWQVAEQAVAPEPPAGTDLVESPALREDLARRLATPVERVRVFVSRNSPRESRDEAQLREHFIAGWQMDSGQWRVMRSVVEGFPNAFQRQVLWLFAIGLVVLVPLAWWFARTLAAPIRRFAAGARRLGTDPQAPALERHGTVEMLEAIDAFNAMQGRISRLLQERSQMIAAIAHDLRTPLMRLAFRLDSLESPLREKVESDIHEMKLMITAALDFLRDQAAGGARERLDLRLLVESVVDDQVDVGHDVSLVSGEPIILRADPLSLRRMVVNLVDNALKYGERARLRLKKEAGEVRLEIDDDGPGIPDSLQQRVFEPFFRAESSRNRDTGGIGLGLTTVRAIVLDHGGHIALRNRHDGGLRVIVSLPLAGQ